ncbi:3-isopropylmalate dehydratase large subunit [Candidatus Woesearchaeota archaeon]|nr:3-isopropylmalate dehydratase large subunit [Candidatus Woesearchaeota archaeon]
MGQTITEKILESHADEKVIPGKIINAKLDIIMCHDVTTPPAISMLQKLGKDRVFDRKKIIVTPDHFIPNKDIQSAELAKRLREWARKHEIENYYEVGNHGVCHAILPEQGHVLPGQVIVGADSHTCTYGALGAFSTGIGSTDIAYAIATGKLWFRVPESMLFTVNGTLGKGVYSKDLIIHVISRIGVDGALYKAMEFCGKAMEKLSTEARMTVTNMAIEAGAKSGIIAPDNETKNYLKKRAKEKFVMLNSDEDAKYSEKIDVDAGELEPLVACPSLPSNVKKASKLKDIKIDQAYLGSCTNGRIEDLRVAARIIKGERIKKGTRMIVVPATTEVYKQANKEGLIDDFIAFGAAVSTPTCGACLGGHMGILAAGERCISSTNRNFVGRMGHVKSEVYLASPATVAASAIEGRITDPRDYL